MRLTPSLTALTLALAGAFTQAQAATYDWAHWNSGTSGTAGSVGLTYSGEVDGIDGQYPNWPNPPATFANGTTVSNAPVAGTNQLLKLVGGGATVDTITFSTAVTNPVIAIWSLGQPPSVAPPNGVQASFVFTQTPTFVAGGVNSYFGGSAITVAGNTVSGLEGNGTVMFVGTFNSISWTNPQAENFYGFTVGVTAVPESETYAMMLAGLGVLGFAAKRRRN